MTSRISKSLRRQLSGAYELTVCAVLILLACGVSAVMPLQAQQPAAPPSTSTWICTLKLDTDGDGDGDSETSHRQPLPQSVTGIRSLAVSANTSQIALHSDGGPKSTNPRILIVSADGTDLKDIGRGTAPDWSPRGGRLLVTTETSETGVWIIRADGSDRQLIDAAGSAAAWSPDGLEIAYVRSLNGRADLVIFNLAELEFRGIRVPEVSVCRSTRQLAWSPDSSRVAYYGETMMGEWQLATVTVNGKSEVDIVLRSAADTVRDLCWPEDSRLVAAMDSADQHRTQLFVIPVPGRNTSSDGQDGRPVRIRAQFTDRNNLAVAVSRSGGVICYISGP
ncbi:MAG: hypothetical protein RIK87_21450 [Fuerstiella sp.]